MALSSRKETYLIFFVIACIIILMLLKMLLELGLSSLNESASANAVILGIITRSFIIFGAIIFICKFSLKKINGFENKIRFSNPRAIIIPVLLGIVVILSNINQYKAATSETLSLSVIVALLIGFSEELTMRGIILPLMIKSSRKVISSVIFSSVIFGLMHYINIFKYNNIEWINGQVLSGFCMGVFFSGLFLRTGNIIVIAILHGFYNFALGWNLLLEGNICELLAADTPDNNWLSITLALIIHGIIIISGLLMVKWSDKQKILEKTNATLSSFMIGSLNPNPERSPRS